MDFASMAKWEATRGIDWNPSSAGIAILCFGVGVLSVLSWCQKRKLFLERI